MLTNPNPNFKVAFTFYILFGILSAIYNAGPTLYLYRAK